MSTSSTIIHQDTARTHRWHVGKETLREYGIVVSFVVLLIVLSVSSGAFLTPTNISNIFDQWSPAAIIALGETLVIIAGGFDLSVGAVFGVGGVVACMVTNSTDSAVLGWAAGAAAGGGLGLVNGLLITVIRINPLIATLASSLTFGGLATALSGAQLVTVTNQTFLALGNNAFLGVKLTIWLFGGAVALAGIALSRTNFGRYVFATGGNGEAARLSGIRTGAVVTATYVLSGICAGLGGVLTASRVATGDPNAGTSIALTTIAAVVVGGNSIQGGYGATWRTVLGVLLLAMIGNGFNLLGVSPVAQDMVQGAIIATAVGVDAWARRTS